MDVQGSLQNASSSTTTTTNKRTCGKRGRQVLHKPSSNHCKTCRQRRVKCDEKRPECQRCINAGRKCEGYTSWEVAVDPNTTTNNAHVQIPAARTMMTTNNISTHTAHQVQLLADFLASHYRNWTTGAPAPGHVMSLLHYLASTHVSLPLLRNAIDTLCLAHIAERSGDLGALHASEDSQRRLLALLQRAIVHSKSSRPLCSHPDVLASILVTGLLPAAPQETSSALERVSPTFLTHFNGALHYLEAHGPSAFNVNRPLDLVLLRHIRMQGIFNNISTRRRAIWNRHEWRLVDVMPFTYFPSRLTTALIAELPGVLQEADQYMADRVQEPGRAAATYALLVRTLDGLQSDIIQPWLKGESTEPVVLDAAQCTKLFAIEENQRHLLESPFTVFFSYSNASHAFCNCYIHLMALVADCTLLHLMYDALHRPWKRPDVNNTLLANVEQRAYNYAGDIARHTFYCLSRSIPGVIFLDKALEAARNFFECYGASRELRWCNSARLVAAEQLDRMRLESPPTMCPIADLIRGVPAACRYQKYKLPP